MTTRKPTHTRPSSQAPRRSHQRSASRQARLDATSASSLGDGIGIGEGAGNAFGGNNGETLLSRRNFLFGAAGVGALAVAGAGAMARCQRRTTSM